MTTPADAGDGQAPRGPSRPTAQMGGRPGSSVPPPGTPEPSHAVQPGTEVALGAIAVRVESVLRLDSGEAALYVVRGTDGEARVLKLYRPKVAPNPEILRAVQQLDAPELLPVQAFGCVDLRPGATCWYELSPVARGGDLLAVGDLRGKYTPGFVREHLVPQVFAGMRRLHDAGIVHSDLKPANVLFLDEERTRIVIGDFGAAKRLGAPGAEMRASVDWRATRSVLSPEQSLGIVSRANDYHALGMILVRLVYPEVDPDRDADQKSIRQRQINKRPIVAFDDRLSGFNELIGGLTLFDFEARWGADEVTRWLAGDVPPVRYADGDARVDPIRVGPRRALYTASDVARYVEDDAEWHDVLLGRLGLPELLRWVKQARSIPEAEDLERLVKGLRERELDRPFVREAVLRFLQPERPVALGGVAVDLFAAPDLAAEVARGVGGLDALLAQGGLDALPLPLFALELALTELARRTRPQERPQAAALLDKISATLGCEPIDAASRPLPRWYEVRSRSRFVKLFFAFDPRRPIRLRGGVVLQTPADVARHLERDDGGLAALTGGEGARQLSGWAENVPGLGGAAALRAVLRRYRELGPPFLKEALLRFLEPARPVRIAGERCDLFAEDDLRAGVARALRRVDDLFVAHGVEAVRLPLFALELAVIELRCRKGGRQCRVAQAIHDEISAAMRYDPVQVDGETVARWHQDPEIDELLEVFYAFDPDRPIRLGPEVALATPGDVARFIEEDRGWYAALVKGEVGRLELERRLAAGGEPDGEANAHDLLATGEPALTREFLLRWLVPGRPVIVGRAAFDLASAADLRAEVARAVAAIDDLFVARPQDELAVPLYALELALGWLARPASAQDRGAAQRIRDEITAAIGYTCWYRAATPKRLVQLFRCFDPQRGFRAGAGRTLSAVDDVAVYWLEHASGDARLTAELEQFLLSEGVIGPRDGCPAPDTLAFRVFHDAVTHAVRFERLVWEELRAGESGLQTARKHGAFRVEGLQYLSDRWVEMFVERTTIVDPRSSGKISAEEEARRANVLVTLAAEANARISGEDQGSVFPRIARTLGAANEAAFHGRRHAARQEMWDAFEEATAAVEYARRRRARVEATVSRSLDAFLAARGARARLVEDRWRWVISLPVENLSPRNEGDRRRFAAEAARAVIAQLEKQAGAVGDGVDAAALERFQADVEAAVEERFGKEEAPPPAAAPARPPAEAPQAPAVPVPRPRRRSALGPPLAVLLALTGAAGGGWLGARAAVDRCTAGVLKALADGPEALATALDAPGFCRFPTARDRAREAVVARAAPICAGRLEERWPRSPERAIAAVREPETLCTFPDVRDLVWRDVVTRVVKQGAGEKRLRAVGPAAAEVYRWLLDRPDALGDDGRRWLDQYGACRGGIWPAVGAGTLAGNARGTGRTRMEIAARNVEWAPSPEPRVTLHARYWFESERNPSSEWRYYVDCRPALLVRGSRRERIDGSCERPAASGQAVMNRHVYRMTLAEAAAGVTFRDDSNLAPFKITMESYSGEAPRCPREEAP